MLAALRRELKFALLERWGLPFSRIPGLSPTLYKLFRCSTPITIVDVGAHRGDFTVAMKKLCGVREALLVEPIHELAEALRHHPDLQSYQVSECLAAETDGERELHVYENFPYISSALPIDMQVEDVAVIAKAEPKFVLRQARTLDSLVNKGAMRHIDLLKVDVQGFEDKVLRGARDALDRTSVALIEVSFRPLYLGSATFNDIYLLMTAKGFALMELEVAFRGQKGELLQADAIFVKPE